MYKYLAPSSPNPFSRRRRGTNALPSLWGEKINVGWVEPGETQLYRGFWMLGFVPQPNLRLNS
ncbi:hypothetical protein FDUTEX481_05581 [Tolypothrix sp. PCC 7601]|nr:hypothetical protein FDUTEX481_05581 [Tolypothrix sp. PCC 7601]